MILGPVLAAPTAAWAGAAAGTRPAGGAALSQIVIATCIAVVLSGAMLALVAGHRSGRLKLIGRLAGASSRTAGLPGWAALPSDLLTGALLIAVFGMYWDISFHLDHGRDPGPLSNPAHYFILFGLFGIFFAGLLAMALPLKRPSRASVRLPNGWQVPLGGLLVAFCGAIALVAFPLDDGWHRLFGQDVTLWGPTHLLLIGGGSFVTLAMWILHVEGQRWREGGARLRPTRLTRIGELAFPGALLVGLSTFQAEFDFGVPQFRLVLDPVLIMLAASVALVAARVRIGRGGALCAVALFLLMRGGLAILVGPVLGHTTPHFPLYIGEAILVELVAIWSSPRHALRFGAISGLAIGTIGLAAEWVWSSQWAPIPWPSSMAFEGIVLGLLAALGGGVVGGFIGGSLDGKQVGSRLQQVAVSAAVAAIAGSVVWGLPAPSPNPLPRASLTLTQVHGAPRRTVAASIRLAPADGADQARWFNVTAWQGGGSVIDPLRPVGPGRYHTTRPIPVYGNWKVTLRLQRGSAILGLPIYLPRDQAIPAPEIPAPASLDRSFVRDKKLLQREQKPGVPTSLTLFAYLVAFALWTSMLGMLGWGLVRLRRTAPGSPAASTNPSPTVKPSIPPLTTIPGASRP